MVPADGRAKGKGGATVVAVGGWAIGGSTSTAACHRGPSPTRKRRYAAEQERIPRCRSRLVYWRLFPRWRAYSDWAINWGMSTCQPPSVNLVFGPIAARTPRHSTARPAPVDSRSQESGMGHRSAGARRREPSGSTKPARPPQAPRVPYRAPHGDLRLAARFCVGRPRGWPPRLSRQAAHPIPKRSLGGPPSSSGA